MEPSSLSTAAERRCDQGAGPRTIGNRTFASWRDRAAAGHLRTSAPCATLWRTIHGKSWSASSRTCHLLHQFENSTMRGGANGYLTPKSQRRVRPHKGDRDRKSVV